MEKKKPIELLQTNRKKGNRGRQHKLPGLKPLGKETKMENLPRRTISTRTISTRGRKGGKSIGGK